MIEVDNAKNCAATRVRYLRSCEAHKPKETNQAKILEALRNPSPSFLFNSDQGRTKSVHYSIQREL